MRLNKLEIINFRFVKNLTFEVPNDSKGIIFTGKNGIGKSTIIDSILWLLCDETLVYGGQNSENLDKSDRKTPVEVSAVFIKDDGSKLELKRILTPKFNKLGEFTKYDTQLMINGAEYSVKQYFARIKNEELGIFIENDPDVTSFNTLRCILDYNYLNTIKYQVAREKIEKLLKITKDEELVNNPKYSLIKDELKAQLYDIAKVKTKFNKQKDLADTQLTTLNRDYENLKNAYKPIDYEELNKLEKAKKIISEKDYEYSVEYKAAMQQSDELNQKLKNTYEEYTIAENNYNSMLKSYNTLKDKITYYNNHIAVLKESFISVKNSAQKCPNCNYELNSNDIRKKLDEINASGLTAKNEIGKIQAQMEKYDLSGAETNYKNARSNYAKLNAEIENQNNKLKEIINLENSQSRIFYNEKAQKLSELESQISNIKAQSNTSAFESKEYELKVARQELAKVEQKIVLLKEFETTKNNLIHERINEVFPNLDFRLYEESDTGAISNTCKVYLKNVGYEGINTGHKIILGFEIIKALRKVLGVKESLPFIFDDVSDLDKENFETFIKTTDNQIITTYVSDKEKLEMIVI